MIYSLTQNIDHFNSLLYNTSICLPLGTKWCQPNEILHFNASTNFKSVRAFKAQKYFRGFSILETLISCRQAYQQTKSPGIAILINCLCLLIIDGHYVLDVEVSQVIHIFPFQLLPCRMKLIFIVSITWLKPHYHVSSCTTAGCVLQITEYMHRSLLQMLTFLHISKFYHCQNFSCYVYKSYTAYIA